MKKIRSDTLKGQHGFILVWSLLLLIVVTLLGAAAISTSIFEEKMAANEALHKQTFYKADGGSENALGLLVANINCISGFKNLDTNGIMPTLDIAIDGDANFWLVNDAYDEINMATDTDRDFHYPSGATSEPHTNGKINGRTHLMTGANLPMLAGYEYKGKAMAADGAFLEYDIKVEHIGVRESRSTVHTKFRLDNQFASYPAGVCVY